MAPLQPQGGHFGLILPLCTASATVGLSLYQFPLFYSFLLPQPSIAGKPLSRHWDFMLTKSPGVAIVAAISATTAVGGAFAARWLGQHATLETTHVGRWYGYGAALAAGHLLVMPLVYGHVRRIIDAADPGKALTEEAADEANRKEMAAWLTVHTARTLLLDIPALWFFAEGVAQAFWVI